VLLGAWGRRQQHRLRLFAWGCDHVLGVCQHKSAGQVRLFVLQLQLIEEFALGLL
jgi:hypothetical protein